VSTPERIVIASRASVLAMWQAQHVQATLRSLYPQCDVSILSMSTRGDEILDRSFAKIGGKGLFVKELENALESGAAQIAVHSMDARDAFVSNRFRSLDGLPKGARVGTSSLRREAQLHARYPSLSVGPVRGNVQTRLRKLDEGEFDAIILAAAGLKRLGLGERIAALVSPEDSLPAPGQGALGIECLESRPDLIAALGPLQDLATAQAVKAERAVSRLLGGNCQVPLGAFAAFEAGALRLRGFVATVDGRQLLRAEAHGPANDPEALGQTVAAMLRAQGADAILNELGASG
jgi:hydroxymethylbilane synthase